ncbi:MAG TPA: NAD+ synthase [Saprospiraceae bacterium]|nr:NAD+ synthase [Saprospiraceae bacterium]MCC6688986.1 NAD+ synthase [Saprospiraceae bacterium]HMV23800.1 NAD+ synthase [Saprospiraceae bacterium]HMX82330.1 NAD+ synthase [Saprospiraceae bacterium]HMX84647.1 NAD+ synthase [Saprospiraceae bacterium]
MKITLAQLNYHIGNFESNLRKMLDAVTLAKEEGSDIICFGELATCGYPPRDFLEFRDFIARCMDSVHALAAAAQGIAIAVGSPCVNPVVEGKDLYNSAFFLFDGKVQHISHKALLPTYDIFDEYRYFEPAHEFSTVEYKGKRIAFTICEDIWNVGNDNPLYKVCPMDEMMKDKPDIMINLSASPFSYDHAESRISAVRANVSKYGVPMFYVNHVGAQTEIIFDGGSLVVSPDLQVFDEMPYFEECIKTYNLADVQKGGINNEQQKEKYRLMHDAIVTGIRDYFGKLGLKKAILGLSGGIDSALTAVLAVRALGAENVWGVLMPSEYSTGHSVTDAKDLAVNLGIRHDIVPIRSVFDVYEGLLNPLFEGKQADVTEENIQARIRGMILMALSNKFGHILLNTSNKSEFAVGYGTLYGDMCGGLAVLGDVYKTEIYKLAAYVNKDGEVIPLNSICKPPSAELRPGQKDSDSLPEYDTLDPVLFQYIENRIGPAELMEMGFDPAMVNRILRLVNINEFKRFQAPPVIRVSNKAFGAGRRLPIVGKYLS